MLESYDHLQLRQREYLLRISRAMTSRLDLQSLLRLILRSAVEMVGGQAGLIVLRETDEQLSIRASIGIPARMLSLFSPLWADLPSISKRRDLYQWKIPNLSRRLQLVAAGGGPRLRQVVALPLVLDAHLEGVIYVFRKRDHGFSSNDRQILASFADQAAIAVRNAQLYHQVLAEKQRLDAIIANSADGIMILDQDHRIVRINHSLAKMTGWPEGAVEGRHCCEVLALHDRKGNTLCEKGCPLEIKEDEEHGYIEGTIYRSYRKPITVGVTYTPLYDQEGALSNIICNVHDITRFREAEELKSTFISVVSHELKTPVALIKGYAGTLNREDANWDQRTVHESLDIIEEESDKLATLIDNLLEASRIQAGALEMEISTISLSNLAAKVTERLSIQSDQHAFILEFPDALPPAAGDPERLESVFYNLLTNAIKYSPGGGDIRVGAEFDEQEIITYVADEGVGISPEEQEQLFKPFSRADSGLTRSTPGAGLGLYLSRAIVEGLDGRMWVDSTPGEGAIFYFSLPRADM